MRACRPSRVELAGEGLECLLVRAKSSVPVSVQGVVLSSRANVLRVPSCVVRVAFGIWVGRAFGGREGVRQTLTFASADPASLSRNTYRPFYEPL